MLLKNEQIHAIWQFHHTAICSMVLKNEQIHAVWLPYRDLLERDHMGTVAGFSGQNNHQLLPKRLPVFTFP